MINIDPKRFTRLREDRGLTRAELALRADISASYVCMIERGQRTVLSPTVAARIAYALDVEIAELRSRTPRLVRPRTTAVHTQMSSAITPE